MGVSDMTISCNSSGAGVTRLSFTEHYSAISGTIGSEIGLLSTLTSVRLFDNAIHGVLPPQLFQLPLIHLETFKNELVGPLPTQVGLATRLTFLDTDQCRISGTIPTEICSLTRLHTLWLRSNRLSGTIPSCLGRLTNIEVPQLFQNQLSGTVPTGLQRLTALTWLALSYNNLVGPAILPTTNISPCVLQADGKGGFSNDLAISENNCFSVCNQCCPT